jgi:cytochrome c oxidase assembly protein subunit 11
MQRNERSFARIALVAVAMFGFGYLLVPLYDVFCEITGLNGKTGQIDEAVVEARYTPDEIPSDHGAIRRQQQPGHAVAVRA